MYTALEANVGLELSNMGTEESKGASSFWTSIPGFLTGLAAVIGAIVAAFAAFHHPAPTATLFVNPVSIHKGQTSTLTWQTSDATIVNIQEIGPLGANGSQSVTPESTTTYHLTAKGGGGDQTATALLTVEETGDGGGGVVPQLPPKPKPPGAGPSPLSGVWRGTLQIPSLPLVFHIDAAHTSTSDSPSQGVFGMPTTAVVSGNTVQLTIPSVGATFQGTLSGSTIAGGFSQAGRTNPLSVTRTGAAPSPGNPTGDWQGTLTFPGVPLVFHINPEGSSTLDSPSQGFNSVPMIVTATGTNLQTDISAAQASYSGTLQGQEIKGTFLQFGRGLPLTLSK
jgi:hypothetical protein